ncbi:MAG: hypothetical protein HQK88_00865 [Nitrospirae bacterium]|nr:hypothetical protein [Nitrospirota bacterium]MBF0535105.1 hypothetical protein [Nitrospirota bacterium]MBF0615345.1 hypothetical protein [Nitrospirota bacterium]
MRFKKILIILLSIVACLSIMEIIAGRIQFWKYEYPSDEMFHLVDHDLLLHHKWHKNVIWPDNYRSIPYFIYINSQSFLAQYEVSVKKPKNFYRIFYLGDSTTQGVVSPMYKMTTIVENELNARYKDLGKKIEVINTGTSSFAVSQYMLFIENTLLEYSPDLIVIDVDMSDVGNDAFYKTLSTFDKDGYPIMINKSYRAYIHSPVGFKRMPLLIETARILVNHSNLAAYLEYLVSKLIIKLTKGAGLLEQQETPEQQAWSRHNPDNKTWKQKINEPETFDCPLGGVNWGSENPTVKDKEAVAYSMKLLGRAIDICRKNNIKIIVTGAPGLCQLTDTCSSLQHKDIEKTALLHKAYYLDSVEALRPSVEDAPADKYYWKSDTGHFNIGGNALWAKAQVDFIVKNNIITGK